VDRYSLVEGLYLYPTPVGTYNAIRTPQTDPSLNALRKLFLKDIMPPLTLEGIQDWTEINDADKATQMLYHLQQSGWIQGLKKPAECLKQPLEELLPKLLSSLSEGDKALLADQHGFYLAAHGFVHEVAEELAALSAELANLHERNSGLLSNNLGLRSSAWAIVDSGGNSEIGFWPLYVGKHRFVLVMAGVPHLNQPDFVQLVWTLSMRYAGTSI